MYLILPFFFNYLVFAAVTPYLPILVRGLGYSPALVGILLGVFEGAGIAGPFIFGHFTDRTGRYRLGLIITLVLSVVTIVPLVFFTNPLISALLLALFALGFRSTTPLLDAAATINLKNSGNYGKIRTVGSFSFVLMVLFLQVTPFLRPNRPFAISVWIALSSAAAAVSMVLIPPHTRALPRAPKQETGGRKKLWSPLLILGLIMIILIRLSMAPQYSFFPLYLAEYLRWDAVGLMFALSSASEIPFMYLSGRLVRRFGPLRLLALSAAAIGVRLAVYALFPSKPALILAQLLHSLCFGIFHPAAVALMSRCVPPERRALGMSLYLSLGTGFPALLGNIAGGFIVDHWGYRTLFASFIVFPVLTVALYLLIALRIKPVVSSKL
ncbi:MAG: MFS transporter [Treponema sp.]|jgi:PPP family 3-phenylpropionic acid transporter|nr:MFS transporter [Treponema sp.]